MLKRLTNSLIAFANLRLVSQDLRVHIKQTQQLLDKASRSTRLMANAEMDRLRADDKLMDPHRLERFGYKGYSQNDEDGIIQEIFRRIGTTDKRFVEFGTGNGLENNTVFLLCQDWCGLWIDGSDVDHAAQKDVFGWAVEEKRLNAIQSFLTVDNINQVIGDAGIKGDIDLLSIDIDGNDYHLWQAINVVTPRVLVIEYNAYAPPPVRWVMKYDPGYVWDGKSSYFGSSLQSLEDLGRNKGYTLVGCNLSGLNAFFVRSDLTSDYFCAEPTAVHLYQPRRWWLDPCFQTEMIPYHRPFVHE
jgi:hypothetical protein